MQTVQCSWCHHSTPADATGLTYCANCGHLAGAPRTSCLCPVCHAGRLLDRLAGAAPNGHLDHAELFSVVIELTELVRTHLATRPAEAHPPRED